MKDKVGIIGLGAMGGIYARHLLNAGFEVIGCDLVEAHLGPLMEQGMEHAKTPKDTAEKVDVLISSLPSLKAVQEVIDGDDGILRCKKQGQILIDTTTLKVEDKILLGELMAEGGKIFLDAPISGTPPMVDALQGSLYVSGDKPAYERCCPIIEGFTGTNYYVGPVGDASKMKILANYLVGVHTLAAAECMVLGLKAGLDPKLIHEVLPKGAGGSTMLQVRGEYMAKSDYRYEEGTIFNVFQKDMNIITEYAASLKSPIHLFAAARQTFNSAVALGLDHLELAAVCKAVEVAAGVDREMVE
ncbi:MAG TPA: NAD(P)-dependent oxidoreductase [Rhodospirillales bacterium]|nr:NAD(P)-dependent oxidoreductase [Rhodospirillales bacterium]HIB20732.1 NAD(P)-dependent oxidoreductase [Rhodospirillales bacterium]HIC59177.1 NAD(P)-dependent oxidoreductase [Rhodospirillales bacterium]HIN75795.1 NAD(P)-dependent oxidoreductase [Rhodospirillales bacterium]HIO37516.1 NAD(P)-dependent oxidoreductase [Rhodospirillales bacterium]